MTYTIDITVTSADTNVAELIITAGQDVLPAQRDAGVGIEAERAISGAANSAQRLIEALGEEWAEASVRIVGHANPGHLIQSGFPNDFASVSVVVTKYKSEVVAPEPEPVSEPQGDDAANAPAEPFPAPEAPADPAPVDEATPA